MVEFNKKNIFSILLLSIPIIFHVARHFSNITNMEIFWLSNIASIFLFFAFLFKIDSLYKIAMYWLSLSMIFWIADIVFNSRGLNSEFFTHFYAPILAFVLYDKSKTQKNDWMIVSGAILGLFIVSKFISPANLNLNLTKYIQPGWEEFFFHNYWLYIGALVLFKSSLFKLINLSLLKIKKINS